MLTVTFDRQKQQGCSKLKSFLSAMILKRTKPRMMNMQSFPVAAITKGQISKPDFIEFSLSNLVKNL
jgi:hypothetical protein